MDLIVSQGRVADRVAGMIEGAAFTAQALAERYGFGIQTFGKAMPPTDDDWRESLPQAKETLALLGQAVMKSIKSGRRPVMLANTCSASIATLPVVARECPDAVVLWIDAHGDFNTPDTTDSGYLGGMVLAAGCGLWDSGYGGGLKPSQVILVGARDIDDAERALLNEAGVRIIPPAQAKPDRITAEIGSARVWIHVDWDVLEPGYLSTDYSVPNGVLPMQLRDIFASIQQERVAGVELAEFILPGDYEHAVEALSLIMETVSPLFEPTKKV